jgi:hypothetical protein
MQVDYGPQLQAIAQALNKTTPWWQHPWVLATVSAALGFIGGLLGQVTLQWFTDRRKLQNMRRMTYGDVCELLAGSTRNCQNVFRWKAPSACIMQRWNHRVMRSSCPLLR